LEAFLLPPAAAALAAALAALCFSFYFERNLK